MNETTDLGCVVETTDLEWLRPKTHYMNESTDLGCVAKITDLNCG